MAGNVISYPEHTAPETNEIVWCRWPRNDGKPPGFKDRPCLVRRVTKHKTTGEIWVQVAFGTTNMDDKSVKSFPVTKVADMDLAGLRYATRFVLTTLKWAPWDNRFFRCLDGRATPVIGRLSDEKVFQLATQMKALEEKLARGA